MAGTGTAQRPTSTIDRYPASGRSRWVAPLAVVFVLLGVFITGAGLGRSASGPRDWLAAGSRPAAATAAPMSSSRPVSLSVPSIKVAAPVHRVGLAGDGSIAVPPLDRHNETGWYDGGPTPGESGSAIIVGHADTKSGPSVFHRLGKLRPGGRIEVTRADRSVAIFEVTSVENFDKENLPAERVYGDFSRPGLRLITCGGRWVGGSTGYADNVVAFATLVGSRDR